MVDGVPVVSPLSADIVRDVDVVESYKMSQTKFYFGNDTELIDLSPSVRGDIALNSTSTLQGDRRVRVSTGINGMVADCIGVTFNTSFPVLVNDDTAKLAGTRTGVFVIHREDALYAYAIPMILTGRPLNSPSGGILGMNLSFTQALTSVPVGNTPTGAGNNLDATTSNRGYIVDVTGESITAVSASTAVPTGGFGVAGPAIIGEAVQ